MRRGTPADKLDERRPTPQFARVYSDDAYRPVPGPVDRTTFFEAQRRNRRASGVFSIVSAVAVLVTGVPLSVVLTPFVYAAVLIGGYAASAISPLPAEAWQHIRDMPLALLATGGLRAVASGTTALTPPQLVVLSAALVLPGTGMLLLVWLALRVLFRHAGVGGVLFTLGARQANPDDLEERRLVNLVQEMSIAAGVKAPRVVLVDSAAAGGAANAAAVGWSIDDATIIVTRPLLDRLSRDETQAIIAVLVASVGNGDLKIAFIVLSLFQTVGVAKLVLNSFFGRRSRQALWQLLRLLLTPPRARARSTLESDVMGMLARESDADDDLSHYMSTHQERGCLGVLQLPLVLGIGFPIMTSNFIVGMSAAMCTGPIVGLLWKRRILLADATAVQLTRNPDGLAGALERLERTNVHVPNAGAVSHLFAVWSDRGSEGESAGSSVAAVSRYMQVKVSRRLAQLQALGAHVDPSERPAVTPAGAFRPRQSRAAVVALLILLPLAVLIGGLLGVALVLMIGLDLIFMTILLLGVWMLAYLIFRYLPASHH
jgi:Zn-dependent protease with chaperone function